MKRTILSLLVLFALAFVLIALFKTSKISETESLSDTELLERKQLASFWDSYRQATQLRTNGLFEEAALGYREALEIDSEHEESLYYLGNCLFELGEYARARELLEKLIAVNPESQRAHAQMGSVLSSFLPGSEPDLVRARQAFERNAELDPEQSGPFLGLGNVALKQKKLDEALLHFETAAGFASPEGIFRAGFVCFVQKRYPKAAGFFEQVLSIGEQERRIASRGGVSEGDTKMPGQEQKLSALRQAEVKSQLYLNWASTRMAGGHGIEESPGSVFSLELSEPERLGLGQEQVGRGSWADIDLDGDPDLIVLSADRVFLLENLGGRFRDRTVRSGLENAGGAWDAAWGDYDGDGDPDLYLICSGFFREGNNLLFRNDRGEFTEITQHLGISGTRATCRAMFLDFDRDGLQDLLEVGNKSGGAPALRMFRYDGSMFHHVTSQLGLEFEGNAVDCAIADFDLDGDSDLFVLRWRRPGILFQNESGSFFRDVTSENRLGGLGGNGYSTLFLDYDQDGRPDLLVTEYAAFYTVADCLANSVCDQSRGISRLFRNAGNERFEELHGLADLSKPAGVIQAVKADFNSDGWPDLLLVTGSLDRTRHEPSRILLNERGGGFFDAAVFPGLPGESSPGGALAKSGKKGVWYSYMAGQGLVTINPPRQIRPG